MKKSNKVNIDTGLFSISFNWNAHVVALHIGVFISLLALTIITREAAIHKLCVTFLAIEVIVLLILFFCRFSITVGEKEEKSTESKDKSEPPEKSDLDITVDHSKKDKKDTTKTSKKEEVINNKVPIPNASSVQSQQSEPESDTDPKQQAGDKEKVIDDMTAKFTDGAMSEEDWEELFKM